MILNLYVMYLLRLKVNSGILMYTMTATKMKNETNFSNHDDSSIERVLCGVNGKRKPIDFYKLRPYFLWKPIDTIKKTFAVTTQFMETVWYNTPRLPLRRHYKSRAPFMNVRRLNKDMQRIPSSLIVKLTMVPLALRFTLGVHPNSFTSKECQLNSCGEIWQKKKILKL